MTARVPTAHIAGSGARGLGLDHGHVPQMAPRLTAGRSSGSKAVAAIATRCGNVAAGSMPR